MLVQGRAPLGQVQALVLGQTPLLALLLVQPLVLVTWWEPAQALGLALGRALPQVRILRLLWIQAQALELPVEIRGRAVE